MCTSSSFAATNSGIQRTKRENLKAAKTTAIELEAEEKGNGIEEDCLYMYRIAPENFFGDTKCGEYDGIWFAV